MCEENTWQYPGKNRFCSYCLKFIPGTNVVSWLSGQLVDPAIGFDSCPPQNFIQDVYCFSISLIVREKPQVEKFG